MVNVPVHWAYNTITTVLIAYYFSVVIYPILVYIEQNMETNPQSLTSYKKKA